MGTSYFASAAARAASNEVIEQNNRQEEARRSDARRKVAAKIVMAVVDKIVADIVRPGPAPEERECYEMAGEVRAIVPDLEEIAKRILDVNDGVD